MKVQNVELTAVCGRKDQYPDMSLPEIAFVGKSNVGKSSLINCMVSRKAIARTSQSPGKTRTINFYNVENIVHFVDLPGYGYARASKADIVRWGKMTEEYLMGRKSLVSIILLIDIRHKPSKDDNIMYEWLKHYGYKIIIVATKSDKLKRTQVSKHIKVIRDELSLEKEDVLIPFSSQNKSGREELWETIKNLSQ